MQKRRMDRRNADKALTRLSFALELLYDDDALALDEAARATALAWSMRNAVGVVEELHANGGYAQLPGMSAALWALVDDALCGREHARLSSLEALVPAGLFEVRRIKGLGAKKVRALWQQLDVTSLGELAYACQENRLLDLRGFGEKTQTSVLEQIEQLRVSLGFMRLDQADAIAARALATLHPHRCAIAGALRRRCELVDEVAIVTTMNAVDAMAKLTSALGGDAARVRCVQASEGGFIWAVFESSGHVEHVRAVVEHARAQGIDVATLACADEHALYDAVGLLHTPPERREPNVPLVARGSVRRELVVRSDLRGALHNHTVASDGTATLRAMRDAAAAAGFSYFAVTDHSQTASYARGLSAASLRSQQEDARALNAEASACTVLVGVESDILKDGALDYPDDVLSRLDVVVASVHNRFAQKGETFTARMCAAVRAPYTDILGHPSGRLLLGRAPAEFDMSKVLEVCAMSGCAVELNANPARLDLNEVHLAQAAERGVLVSIAADAHSVDALGHIDYGVSIARRAGLRPEQILNTLPLPQLRAWLSTRRDRALAAA